MVTLNRLEENWNEIKPLILQEWARLNDADLESTEQKFDRLVEVVRERYGGRVEIIQEAAIRNRLNQFLKQIES